MGREPQRGVQEDGGPGRGEVLLAGRGAGGGESSLGVS